MPSAIGYLPQQEMVLEQVRETIRKHGLLEAGECVVVGVSGGPDSLCLLHLLTRLQVEYGLALHVAHLDHQLRGQESTADAEYVAEVARQWGLPCTVAQVDVRAAAKENRLSLEEAARQARYGFLARIAEATGGRTIAVGHNADDQAETVLMHWLRGSGLAGLRGMLARSRLADYRLLEPAGEGVVPEDMWLVRPLLDTPREVILRYCASEGLEPRSDLSNLDTTYFRNWLRHAVLPLLAQHNPGVRDVLCRSAQVLAEDYSLLCGLLDQVWPSLVTEESTGRISFGLTAWRDLPVSVQRSSLREAVRRLRRTLRDIGFVHIEDAVQVAREGPAGRKATLPQGLMLSVGYDRLTVADAEAGEALPDWPLLDPLAAPVPVAIPGRTPLPGSGWALEADLVSRNRLPSGWEDNSDPWLACLDWPEAAGPLRLRARRPGDRFRPMGMGGREVKLADWLTNRKVPRAARTSLPLLFGQNGIVWVCGQRVDEGSRVRRDSERVLVLRFVRE